MGDLDRVLNRIDKVIDTVGDIKKELGINSAQHDSMNNVLQDVKAQVTATNGRVTVLEKFKVKIVAYATVIAVIMGGIFKMLL